MSIDEIRALKHADPFRPFNIVMSNGRTVYVECPERIALSPTGRTVAVYEGPAVSFFEVPKISNLEADAVPPAPPWKRKKKEGQGDS